MVAKENLTWRQKGRRANGLDQSLDSEHIIQFKVGVWRPNLPNQEAIREMNFNLQGLQLSYLTSEIASFMQEADSFHELAVGLRAEDETTGVVSSAYLHANYYPALDAQGDSKWADRHFSYGVGGGEFRQKEFLRILFTTINNAVEVDENLRLYQQDVGFDEFDLV